MRQADLMDIDEKITGAVRKIEAIRATERKIAAALNRTDPQASENAADGEDRQGERDDNQRPD